MKYTGNTRERLYQYLVENGPSTSLDIERALGISQPTVSLLLRSEPDLIKGERQPGFIYSKKINRDRKPLTLKAAITGNMRTALEFYEAVISLDPETDAELIEVLAKDVIAKYGRLIKRIEALLAGDTEND